MMVADEMITTSWRGNRQEEKTFYQEKKVSNKNARKRTSKFYHKTLEQETNESKKSTK
jgi:hypothetical protein